MNITKKLMEKMEASKAKKAECKDMIENDSVENNFKPSVYIIDSKTFEPFDNLVKKSLKYKV